MSATAHKPRRRVQGDSRVPLLWVCVAAFAFLGCGGNAKPPSGDAGPVNVQTDPYRRDASVSDSGSRDAQMPEMDARVGDAAPSDDASSDGATNPDGDAPDAESTDPDAAEPDAGPPLPDCLPARYAQHVETLCDDLDNDCDGVIDELLPVPQNACTPTGDSCAQGFAACVGGARVCLAPGPSPEVGDQVDNDCNGSVDDIDLSYEVRPRALILIPGYMLIEGLGAIDNVAAALDQWGVPYDVAVATQSFDQQLAMLDGHSLAIIPGYLLDDVLTVSRVTKLENFAKAGGIVVAFKPVLDGLTPFFGLANSARRLILDSIDFSGTVGAARAFDTPEERSLPLTGPGDETPEAYVLTPSDNTVRVVAQGMRQGVVVGPVITYRPLGKGGIYAVGHNLYSFDHKRCEINCFEPSGDVAGLFLREAFRDSAQGHVALMHTVPGEEDSLLMLTHDLDAPDAQNAGADWGAPGALQVAVLEARYGARGSYMVTTNYVDKYYNPALMQDLCDLGVCPVGAHGVTHKRLGSTMGSCSVTAAQYDGETVTACGEISASLELLERDVGVRPIAWRAPYLSVPSFMYDLLASKGILFDSSYTVGDLKFNLPLSLERISIQERIFHHQRMYSMPISIEDGVGDEIDGNDVRTELTEATAARFLHQWVNVMLRNADNHGHTMASLHPSYGNYVPADNLRHKLGMLEAFLQASAARGVKFDMTVDELARFWRAREASKLTVQYTRGVYTGTVRTGQYPVRDLTLEFGDPVNSFSCEHCGETRVVGNRVVLAAELEPATTYAFTVATPVPAPPDAGTPDGGEPDGGAPDGSTDAGTDGGLDGGTDAGTDGGLDGGTDAGTDGGLDGGTDAGLDGGLDGGTDSGLDAGPDAGPEAGPRDCVPEADREEIETRCDGLDNDCNGVIDALLPVAANACAVPGQETCGGGFAACELGERVCLAPGPSPEVEDGADNDCNGTVDDYDVDYETRPRALVLVPSYLLIEGLGGLDNVTSFLEAWGVPYDVAMPYSDFDDQLDQLPGHSIAIVAGYLLDEVLTTSRSNRLEAFAQAGGVVVVFKPVLDHASTLMGLTRTVRRIDLDSIDFVSNAGAARAFDTTEERSIPLTPLGEDVVEAFVLTPSDPNVQVVAQGTLDGASVGPLITYRPTGAGGVYAVGHDLYTFLHYRCYVNCFEPSGDLAGLFMREAYRDSARGHVALVHTVPGPEDSLATITHDVDAPDAQNAGAVWGAPGALQVAQLEAEYGARGSYMVTTDYVANYYNPALMQDLCDLDMCPVGTHSITHTNLTTLPAGDCSLTAAQYDGSNITVCPEIRISLDLLERDVGTRPIAWRAPYLGVPPFLFDLLHDAGILFDSSYAVGELKFNLPLSAERTAIYEWMTHRHPLYTMPISIEDGIGETVDGTDVRSEMGEANGPKFIHHWVNVMLRNADNHAHTMALLHPSYGMNVGQDNLRHKLVVLEAFMQAAVARGVKLDLTVDQLARFWRARERSKLDVSYAGGVYTGSVQVGAYGVQNLTLEFGEPITAFDCATCGATRIVGNRVVLQATLSPNTTYSFTADALPH